MFPLFFILYIYTILLQLFLIESLYFHAKQTFIGNNITEYNIDKLFEKVVKNCQQSFSKSLLSLLQNRLYYDVVKNNIVEQFYNI